MKFVVDGMLGKLAKWLLILGFDTSFDPRRQDDDLLALARKESRVLLTRDHGLLDRARGLTSLFVASEKWQEQVGQVLRAFDLESKARPHSRCLVCNVPLKPLTKARARNLVSAFVHEKADSFALCPSCGRVFWQGTHFQAMDRNIKEFLGKKAGPLEH